MYELRFSTVAASGVFWLLIALAGCDDQTVSKPPKPFEVGVITVAASPVPVYSDLSGRTNAYLVSQVRARVDGIVLRREFTEGANVQAGQLLYKIDPAPYIAALNSSKAALARAEANLVAQKAQLDRYEVLVAGRAISQQDYDNALANQGKAAADVSAAKADLERAQINLSYTNVVSPISGRIGLSEVTPGAYVQANGATLMTTVQQLDPMYVDLTQSSAAGLKLRIDIQEGRIQSQGEDAAEVELTLENGKVYGQQGKLQFSDVSVDQGTGSVTVRAVFPNKDNVLLPGMFVRARLHEGTNNAAMLVPQVGVTHNQAGQPVALLVGADNKVSQTVLTTSGTRGADWIVTGGLNPGDRVIVQGTDKVRPGAVVEAVPAELAQCTAADSTPDESGPRLGSAS